MLSLCCANTHLHRFTHQLSVEHCGCSSEHQKAPVPPQSLHAGSPDWKSPNHPLTHPLLLREIALQVSQAKPYTTSPLPRLSCWLFPGGGLSPPHTLLVASGSWASAQRPEKPRAPCVEWAESPVPSQKWLRSPSNPLPTWNSCKCPHPQVSRGIGKSLSSWVVWSLEMVWARELSCDLCPHSTLEPRGTSPRG